ncbi:MAG TPA: hypothetical protein VM513_08645 [Kofleriaceae bacterium]|nr:hypothetical protein [Kofleriaceae bacterium]
MFRAAPLLAMLLCSMTGCGGDSGAACMVDEDCPSRFCRADGTCAPAEDAAGGADMAGDDAPGDGGGACTPNHDGSLTLAELPLMAGKMATFRVALDATFDTAGTPDGGGARRWDLSGALANDADRALGLLSPTGTWWAATFPTASYASTLSAESDLLGVFHVDATGLTLLGVVSPTAGGARTELEYDPPAQVLAFPITDGATWTSESIVSGLVQGVAGAYSEEYASMVDKVGTMKTPYGEFPVVRVATDLTRTSGGFTILTKRTFAWMSECFGAVANVSSQDYETSAEFNDPAEVRRIAP